MSIAPDPASTPTGVRVTAGVDKDDHAVCVVGDQGEAIDRFTVAHDGAGLKRMVARLLRAGVEQVGIDAVTARWSRRCRRPGWSCM